MKTQLIKLAVLLLAGSLTGCAYIQKFQNKGKRETLVSADKELDSLITDQSVDCSNWHDRLLALKAKVKAEMDQLK